MTRHGDVKIGNIRGRYSIKRPHVFAKGEGEGRSVDAGIDYGRPGVIQHVGIITRQGGAEGVVVGIGDVLIARQRQGDGAVVVGQVAAADAHVPGVGAADLRGGQGGAAEAAAIAADGEVGVVYIGHRFAEGDPPDEAVDIGRAAGTYWPMAEGGYPAINAADGRGSGVVINDGDGHAAGDTAVVGAAGREADGGAVIDRIGICRRRYDHPLGAMPIGEPEGQGVLVARRIRVGIDSDIGIARLRDGDGDVGGGAGYEPLCPAQAHTEDGTAALANRDAGRVDDEAGGDEGGVGDVVAEARQFVTEGILQLVATARSGVTEGDGLTGGDGTAQGEAGGTARQGVAADAARAARHAHRPGSVDRFVTGHGLAEGDGEGGSVDTGARYNRRGVVHCIGV